MEWRVMDNCKPVEGIREKLMERGILEDSRTIDKHISLWLNKDKIDRFTLDGAVENGFGILYGSSTYHHLTYFICRDWVDEISGEYDVFILDAHNDTCESDFIDCATFIPYILEKCNAVDAYMRLGDGQAPL